MQFIDNSDIKSMLSYIFRMLSPLCLIVFGGLRQTLNLSLKADTNVRSLKCSKEIEMLTSTALSTDVGYVRRSRNPKQPRGVEIDPSADF